eukprot:767157-Hanusia_phi.AAC.6
MQAKQNFKSYDEESKKTVRTSGFPRTMKEMCAATLLTKKEIGNAFKHVQEIIKKTVQPMKAKVSVRVNSLLMMSLGVGYHSSLLLQLKLGRKCHRRGEPFFRILRSAWASMRVSFAHMSQAAKHICQAAEALNITEVCSELDTLQLKVAVQGRVYTSTASAAMFMACLLRQRNPKHFRTCKEISDATGAAEATIRQIYKVKLHDADNGSQNQLAGDAREATSARSSGLCDQGRDRQASGRRRRILIALVHVLCQSLGSLPVSRGGRGDEDGGENEQDKDEMTRRRSRGRSRE